MSIEGTLECLSGVIGLSNNPCACFEADRPSDYNDSASGYYLDDPEYGLPLKIPQSLQDCGESNLWNVLALARSAGINQFITDLGANILSGPFKKKIEPFTGWVGRASNNLNLTTGVSTYAGVKISPVIFRGTIAKTFQIELYIQGRNGETIEIGFYDYDALQDGVPLGTVDVDILNNKGTVTLSEAFVHDFMSSFSQSSDLWILYQPGAGTPRNNTFKCATCGAKELWYGYFNAYGVTGSTLPGVYDSTNSGYSYGLRINLGVSCGNSWLCQNFDFENDAWARVMAECIMLYGIKKLCGIVLNDTGPNRYTQLGPEQIGMHRDRVNKLLGERMPWLSDNIPVDATDCFTCNTRQTVMEYMV